MLVIFDIQVELNSTLVLDKSSILPTCSMYVRAFSLTCSGVSAGLVSDFPDGSPIMPVKSPIRNMTSWPRSWNCFIFWMRTVWPMCRSGAVGSKPALTRSGFFSLAALSSFLLRSSSEIISAAPRVSSSICAFILSMSIIPVNGDM